MSANRVVVAVIEGGPTEGYRGSLEVEGYGSVPMGRVLLSPGATVSVCGSPRTLKEMVDLLGRYDPENPNPAFGRMWNEQGQQELGAYLALQLFESLTPDGKRALDEATGVRLVIVTSDEFVARLPWACLVWNRATAVRNGWSVAVSPVREFREWTVLFPRFPRFLVVAPEPEGAQWSATESEAHVDELLRRLGERMGNAIRDRQSKVVRTWDELLQATRGRPWDAVYYYGHADDTNGLCRLVFEEGEGRAAVLVPMANFSGLFAGNGLRKPSVMYVNCCRGHTPGVTGVGWQLSTSIAAVVTNRAVAFQRHAREQALVFWEDLLGREASPEEAMVRLYGLADARELHVCEPHWMTPALYVGYGRWLPGERPGPGDTPYWEQLIDRTTQFGVVTHHTSGLVERGRKRGVAYVWFGGERAGTERFHDRLRTDLAEELRHRCSMEEVRLVWPDALGGRVDWNVQFEEMIRAGFAAAKEPLADLNDLPGALSRLARAGGKMLLYLRHTPVEEIGRFPMEALVAYLKWWDRRLLPVLERGQSCLLGISYRVPESEAAAFEAGLKVTHQLEDHDYEHAFCHVLAALDLVPRSELLRFLRENREIFGIDRNGVEEVADWLLDRTGGHYEDIVRILQWIQEHGLPPDLNDIP